jgi:tetratricopeptide (TPR) repeat protein
VAYQWRAYSYWCEKDGDHALADLDQIARLRPDEPKVYFERLTLLLDKGEHNRALADIDRIVQLIPKESGPYFFRAVMALLIRNDRERAIADLDRAAALEPCSPYFALRGFLHARKLQLVPTCRDLALALLLADKTEYTFVGEIDRKRRRCGIGLYWSPKDGPRKVRPGEHASDTDGKCVEMGVQRLLAATFGASR